MKWLKKVAATPLTTIARVVDSLSETTNDRTNAPSIHAVREAVNNNWLSIYPIGSIYMSVNNVNPSTVFGGTWEQIKDKFLLACGDIYNNGATGGSATHTLAVNQLPSHNHSYTRATGVGNHTLTINEIPSHNHQYNYGITLDQSHKPEYTTALQSTTPNFVTSVYSANATNNAGGGQGHNHPITSDTQNTGGAGSGAAINHMPPYLAVNVWVRTA
jgi:microcystin-dependent protein